MRAARRWASVALLVAGAVALGWAAGAGAAPARKGRRAAAKPDTVLVRIGDEAITRATVQKRLDELPDQVRSNFTSAEGRQRLLERLVEERIWLKAAVKAGVAERPEVKRQMEQQRRDVLIRTYVNEVMSQNPAPSDSEAHAHYQEHLADYRTPSTVTLSHILVKTESDAKRVVQTAKQKGQDWKKLATRWSLDTLTRTNGGALGTVTNDGLFGSIGRQPALAEAAFALGEGKIGGPHQTDRGWHVIKVESIKAESTRPFEQVRGNIVSRISSKRQQEFYQSRLEEERRRLGVRPDSNAIKSFLSQRKSAREMFNEAQNAGPAAARIEAYREMLRLYPDSEVSPQAQFMLGFIHSEELKNYEVAEQEFRELLRRYPQSELAASAQWMLEHMRTEDAPGFMNLESDSATAGMPKGAEGAKDKP